jgi:hypothetical protein
MKIFFLLLSLTLCVSCSQQTNRDYRAMQSYSPRELPANSVLTVAVLPLSGKLEPHVLETLTLQFENALYRIRVKGQPYFKVIEKNRRNEVLEELRLNNPDYIDERYARKFGKMLGADAVIIGHVGDYQLHEENKTEAIDNHNTANCKQMNFTAEFSPRIIKVETGEILFAGNYSENLPLRECDRYGPFEGTLRTLIDTYYSLVHGKQVNKHDLAQSAKDKIFENFTTDVALALRI